MANPLKGEVDLVVGEATYTLHLDIEEIVQMENMLDMRVLEIANEMQQTRNPRLGFWRVALWAAMRSIHPETSLEDASGIIKTVKLPMVMTKVSEAMTASFPKAEPDAKPGAKPSPRKASRRGTGKPSS